MGKTEKPPDLLEFTDKYLKERELIISMLRYEDKILNDEEIGQAIYRNSYNDSLHSLEPQFIMHRLVLKQFGFTTSDYSVKMYREIFRTYYKSPTEFDAEVINSVAYMRANRCIYYTSQKIEVGDKIPNVDLLNLNGSKANLFTDVLGIPFEKALLCAFSSSWPPFLKRKDELILLVKKLEEKSIRFVLIQIEEAHSDKWKIGLDYHPQNHASIEDRLKRANDFVIDNKIAFPMYVDDWANTYEQTFQAWPDKYYLIDKEMVVLKKSIYGKVGDSDGKVMLDCLELVKELTSE